MSKLQDNAYVSIWRGKPVDELILNELTERPNFHSQEMIEM
jgi:hypothetical protein